MLLKFKHHLLNSFWLFTFFSPAALAEYRTNIRPGVTAISHEIYFLHMTIFWICVVIGVGVFGVMFYALIRHRRSRHAVSANFHESTTVEIIWTLIPFLILIGMAIPATRVLIDMDNTNDADLTIKITGYQWKWHYEYVGKDIEFFSNLATSWDEINNLAPKDHNYLHDVDHRLILPAHRKVRFLLTANDVIHSWFVPELGVKKDAIPGFINEIWTHADVPGVYRGQCTELCGALHGYMPIVVEVKPEAEFDEWLTAQKPTAKKEG